MAGGAGRGLEDLEDGEVLYEGHIDSIRPLHNFVNNDVDFVRSRSAFCSSKICWSKCGSEVVGIASD